MKVFVYGTLKHGYGNHGLLERATFIGNGETVAACRVYDAGFPVLRERDKDNAARNAKVRGEVYECDAETVHQLDRLESEGVMYHRRHKMIALESGELVKAALYVGDTAFWKFNERLLPLRDGKYEWSRTSEPTGADHDRPNQD